MQAYADPESPHDLAIDEAFERLYRSYVRDVYRYTLAVLRNPADAEDITQTTFLNAYRAYLRGEEPGRPRHWLIKIAHNACRSRHLRAVRRPQEVPLEETIAAVPVSPDDAPKVEELLGIPGLYEGLLNRSGLNCAIEVGGTIRPGDAILPLDE